MQKESAAEIELSLKKKARRRLVGAIALVLLMVVLLPFLLKDRSASSTQEQVEITIADEAGLPQNEAGQSQEGQNELTQPLASDFDSSVVSSEPSSASEDIAKPSLAEPVEQVLPANDNPPQTVKTVTNKPSLLKDAVIEQAETKQPAPEPKPLVNKEIVKPEAKPSNTDKDQFFVQVGVFSDPNNVKQLQAKLTSIGYASKTEKVSTPKGEKIRLKTQVFSSRTDAASALDKIKQAGLTGMVVSQ